MAAPTLYTYEDLVDHLVSKERHGASLPAIRQAVISAYDDLHQKTEWKYYWAEHQINLKATVTTGTITYDHTGGASERLLTFSDALTGDALTNAIYYRITISDVNYPIAELKSSTTATLREDSNPQADVAAGTSYTLYRNVYTLPANFKTMRAPHPEDGSWGNTLVPMDSWQGIERHIGGQRTPRRFSIGGDPNLFGSMAIFFADIPDTDEGMRFMYHRMPEPIRHHGQETAVRAATVETTADSTTTTLSSGVLDSTHVGSVFRVYDTSNHPTGITGAYPFKEQKVITAVSGTAVTVDSKWVSSHAATTKFTVSDPIDIRPTMLEALFRGAEWKLDVAYNRKEEEMSYQVYLRACRLAMESDATSKGVHERARPYDYYHGDVTTV